MDIISLGLVMEDQGVFSASSRPIKLELTTTVCRLHIVCVCVRVCGSRGGLVHPGRSEGSV